LVGWWVNGSGAGRCVLAVVEGLYALLAFTHFVR
jgi:hypothetical protein